ncbi:MAG: CARDB domain-containing protein [Bacteroidota bacterium]
MRILFIVACLWVCLDPVGAVGQQTFVITDNLGAGTGTTTLSRKHTYLLDGPVYVNRGDVLSIESGTIIKGRYSSIPGQNAMLIVSDGAQIRAEGMEGEPIIFTSEGDKLETIGNTLCASPQVTYLSDLPFDDEFNGWGPVERDQSNGETQSNDGSPIQINGKVYTKGLGMHASDPDFPNPPSIEDDDITHVTFELDGQYDVFKSDIGPQDDKAFVGEVATEFSVEFVVLVDGVEKFRSGVVRSGDLTQYIEVDVSDAEKLELRLLNGGSINEATDGNRKKSDHGNWGNARLETCNGRGSLLRGNIDPAAFDSGLWGGLVLLGSAPSNAPVLSRRIAGLPEDSRNSYGGVLSTHNSGILRYISIRHGGGYLDEEQDIKANGLTLAAVGSSTVIEHIEVYSSFDDGIEICGGEVNAKWLSMAFSGDDGFDIDQGYQGRGQFWLSLSNEGADVGGSHDGGDRNLERPFTLPRVFNATFIGSGSDANANRYAMLFADGAAGRYGNSIFTDFAQGIFIETLSDETDSYTQFQNSNLELRSNLFWNIGSIGEDCNELFVPTSGADEAVIEELKSYFESANNVYNNPVFRAFNAQSFTPGQEAFFPLPEIGGFAYQGLEDLPDSDSFYDKVGYKGAFGEDMWLSNWSALASYGFLGTKGGNHNPNTLKADLILENVSSLPDPLDAGQSFTLTLDVRNGGDFKSGATTVRASLEGSATALDVEQITPLGKGGSLTNLVLSITLPAILSGPQELVIEVDPGLEVEEKTRNNNFVVLPFTLDQTVELPDMEISSFSVSENPTTPGTSITLNFDVENKGQVATGIIPLKILLGGSTELLVGSIANVAPGQTRSVSRIIQIPANASAGELLLEVFLDPENTIQESNEDNNQAGLELEILGLLPDLVLTELETDANSVEVGELFTLSLSIENSGQESSGNFDLWITANGELVSSRQLPGLSVGSSSFLELQVALPASITSDQVELSVVIDPDNKILEENKGNNARSVNLTVIPTERQFADLTLTLLTPDTDSLTVTAGESFDILVRIQNSNGDTLAAANQIRIELNDQLIDTLVQPELNRVDFRDLSRNIEITEGTPAGFYQFVAKVDAKDEVVEKSEENNADTLIVIVKSPNPDGGDALSITQTRFPRYHTMGEGNITNPTIVVSDLSKVIRVEFSYKPISAPLTAFQTVDATNGGGSTFTASFSDAEVGEIGISYFFTVFNRAEGEEDVQSELGHTYLRYTGEGLTLPTIQTGSTVSDYQILSIPLNLDNSTVSSVFVDDIDSDQNKTKWRLMQWNGSNTLDVSTSSNVTVGRSYWLLIVDPATIDTGPGTTVEVTESSPLVLNLSTQFTQVGNPYNFAVSWQDILEANGNPEGLTFTTYNNGYTNDTQLDAFEGGFIQNNGPVTSLEIPVLKNENINRFAEEELLSPLTASAWKVPINLASGNLIHRVSGIGMHPDASDNWDLKDVAGFPRFESYLDIHFPRLEHRFDRIAFDYITPRTAYSWDLTVSSTLNKTITLEWENQYFGENDRQLWLEDLQTGAVVDMRLQQSFEFFPAYTQSHFRVHFGDLDYVKTQVRNRQAWIETPSPNPFTQRLSFSLQIPPLQGPSLVSCSLFNLMGQRVGGKEWHFPESGNALAKWDLQSLSLPQGVYTYRIFVQTESGQEVKSGKLIKQ